MKCRKFFNHRLVLVLTNILLMASAVVLIIAGIGLFTDRNRVLLSRLVTANSEKLSNLPQPLFFYVALGLGAAGLITFLASFVGWWTICATNYWTLSLYFIIILSLLLFEFSGCLLLSLWPQCLGLQLEISTMVKMLQGSYGVSGKEQLTAAIDLAQTQFECCAINNNINYDTSLWRLQGLGNREWTVPLTCCRLSNRHEPRAYLDPKPENSTLCQSLQKHEYTKSRHEHGCLIPLDQWYRIHFDLFFAASAIFAFVQFLVMISIILSCLRIQPQKKVKLKSTGTTMSTMNVKLTRKRQAPQPTQLSPSTIQIENNENIYSESQHRNDAIEAMKNSFDHHYHVSKSYLV